jgi:hypothetical protein
VSGVRWIGTPSRGSWLRRRLVRGKIVAAIP